jgi:CheY-like chemotaxis protein
MSRTVLIVDDSKLARMSIAKLLGQLRPDWARLEAANTEEALAAAGSNAVDLTVLDFNMPGRDGLALASDLRNLYPAMPIAVVSANTQQEVTERVRALGANFLTKPIAEADLKAFIDAADRQLQVGAS